MKYLYKTILVVVILLPVILLNSCSHKEAFAKSVIVPGASGQVKLKKEKNNNYAISVWVRDLTPPKNLVPAKETYVVWNESDNGTTNLGRLETSRSLFSRGFKASLTAVSPQKPRRIFITAEDDPQAVTPGTQVVLISNNF
jgi:hypothetical protein